MLKDLQLIILIRGNISSEILDFYLFKLYFSDITALQLHKTYKNKNILYTQFLYLFETSRHLEAEYVILCLELLDTHYAIV